MAVRPARSRALALTLALAALLLVPLQAAADDPDAGTVDLGEAEPAAEESEPVPAAGGVASSVGEKIFDVAVLRPLGVGATAGGMAFYLISVPFVAPAMNLPVTWDIFVLGPYDYTFVRPLGEF